MALSVHRVLEDLDGEFRTGDTATDAIVCVDVEPGHRPRLDVEVHGLGAREKAVATTMSRDDARALGQALLDAADEA